MQVTNRTLITGGADGTVRFWDIETSQPLHVIDLVRLSGVVEIGNDLKKNSLEQQRGTTHSSTTA